MLQSGRGYYVRLEARLDPVERMLKAMDLTDRYVILHSIFVGCISRHENTSLHGLRRQRMKHLFWCAVDFIFSIAALAIAFLPGPNLVGWYPFPAFTQPLSRVLRDTRAAAFQQRYRLRACLNSALSKKIFKLPDSIARGFTRLRKTSRLADWSSSSRGWFNAHLAAALSPNVRVVRGLS